MDVVVGVDHSADIRWAVIDLIDVLIVIAANFKFLIAYSS
jgi:hypothetical protein